MAFTTLIDTETLARHLTDPAFAILDCRFKIEDVTWGEHEYSTRHIPGAIHADLEHDLSGERTGANGRHPLPDAALLAGTFGRYGIDAGIQVVAYDQDTGMYASRLWWMLRWLGHDAVAVLDGGFARWTAENRATVPGRETRQPRRFTGAPRDGMTVTALARGLGRRSSAAEGAFGTAARRDRAAGRAPRALSSRWRICADRLSCGAGGVPRRGKAWAGGVEMRLLRAGHMRAAPAPRPR